MSEIVTCPNCGKRNRVPAVATGVPRCAACHTALVEGYVVEGHVPDDVIRKMVAEKPKVVGIG